MLAPCSSLRPDELLGELQRVHRVGVPTWLASAFDGSIEELERALAVGLDGPPFEAIRARAVTLLELHRPPTPQDGTPLIEITRGDKGRRPADD
jgi:hypothetical protein